MGEFFKAAKKQDVPAGSCVVSDIQGTPVAIYNVGGDFFATHNICLHRGGPLGEGELEGKVVTCPWHGWQYDVTSGCNTDNADLKVKKFNVKIEGDDVFVELE